MGPVTDVPLLDRGSPETEQGPAVANPRIRVCSTVVFSAAPCHARSPAKDVLPSRSGDEPSCLTPWKRDMRVDTTEVTEPRHRPPPPRTIILAVPALQAPAQSLG